MKYEDIYTGVFEKTLSPKRNDEETDFLNAIVETLEQISEYGESIVRNILNNVVFIFQKDTGLTQSWKGYPSNTIVISFDLHKLLNEEQNEDGSPDRDRIKSIIAHECAHYTLRHYILPKVKTFEELEEERIKRETEADDLSESWGFERVNNYE